MWGITFFLALCGLSTILLLVPLAWHIKNRNVSAICLIAWIILFNLISFVNALIWGGDNFADSWSGIGFCDVEIKLIIASASGTMAAAAAISRNLARIMSDNVSVIKTKSVRRRELLQDLLICFAVPAWMVTAHYIVQPNRYYIIGIVGCQPSVDNSWPTIVLLYIWPPVIALIAAYYACLVLFRIHKYRQKFSEILRNSDTRHTKSRFFRLFLFGMIIVIINLPLSWYVFYRNLKIVLIPYSWKLVHGVGWNYIPKIHADSIQFDRWIPVMAGYVSFIFFGTGSDATKMYRGWAEFFGLGKYLANRSIRTTPKNGKWSSSDDSTLGSSTFSKTWATGKRFLLSTSSGATDSSINNTLMSSDNHFNSFVSSPSSIPQITRVGTVTYAGPETRDDGHGIKVEKAVEVLIEDGKDEHRI